MNENNGGLESVIITEDELVALLDASEKTGQVTSISWGRPVLLRAKESNRWAFEAIAKMRSNVR